MHDLGRAIDLWIGELARRGLSPRTRQKYFEVLQPFHRRYSQKALSEIQPEDCDAYMDRWAGASKSTIALYVTVLRGFFARCVERGWIDESPADHLKRPRRPRPEDVAVVSISSNDVAALLAACHDWDELLCLSVIAYLGPRRTAAANVRRGDVDLDNGTIRFLEKGGKVAVKPLPTELEAIIRAADESGVWLGGGDYLIPNRRRPKRPQRSAKVVYAIVKRVADRARVNVHPHALRAAFAVQFDEQHPQEIWALKELLGHSRIETTLVYLRRKNRARAMEAVRDLSWGASVFPPSRGMPPAGFEPALEASSVPEPIRLKLAELAARSRGRVRS
ncbi:MAG TPA: tyrosine-type recombinase/integrase [Verrucomicrobiae bacterium]|nr:tyrosine-type recombinase/integrase [Verrucomicrobiae bacterium]